MTACVTGTPAQLERQRLRLDEIQYKLRELASRPANDTFGFAIRHAGLVAIEAHLESSLSDAEAQRFVAPMSSLARRVYGG